MNNRDAIAIVLGFCGLGGCVALMAVSAHLAPNRQAKAARPDASDVATRAIDGGALGSTIAQTPDEHFEELRRNGVPRDVARRLAYGGSSLNHDEDDSPRSGTRAGKTGTVRMATHLFDSKEAVKRAAGATGRAGGIGYLHEAAQHGTPVEAGERVNILSRSFTSEYVQVVSIDSGASAR